MANKATALVAEPQTDWLAEAQHIAELYTPPDGPGRPSSITDRYRVEKLLRLVAAGNYLETAAAVAGISKATLYNWREAAKAGDLAAIAFTIAYEKAEAEAEANAVANVRKAGQLPQFWAAEMTYLERRKPERWGRRQDDSGAGPKVVVQIGGSAQDVKVGVLVQTNQPAFASEVSTVSEPLHSLTGDIGSDKARYVNHE